MNSVSARTRHRSNRFSGALKIGASLAVGAIALSGCSSIKNAIKHKVESKVEDLLPHSAALNAFTNKVNTSQSTTYEVTYVTTGAAPATIQYAADPPHDIAFDGNVSQGGGRFIQNASGDFACTQNSSTGKAGAWSCLKLDGSGLAAAKAEEALYSGKYWVDFLRVYSVVSTRAAGVKITSGSLTVNGFNLSCVIVTGGKSNPGTSKWCITAQGILGYVSVSSTKTVFEIKSYTTSPAASLFTLPAGATITTIPASVTSTTKA